MTDERRTIPQNKAIHKYCEMLAAALNERGLGVMEVMKHDAEIPWSKESAKEYLWRSIQIAWLKKESTTELTPKEVGEVYQILSRHLAQTTGVSVAFPDKESE